MDINIAQETCCREECHVTFWITTDMQRRLKSTNESFYCPNGHGMHYTNESDESKIRRLEREKQQVMRDSNQKIFELKEELEKKCKRKKHAKK